MNSVLELYNQKADRVKEWIDEVLKHYELQKRPVGKRMFVSLPNYFSSQTLGNAFAVYVKTVPVMPLHALGIDLFPEMETNHPAGITYVNCFFIQENQSNSESLHFHELIHVLQWDHLGIDRFLFCYALGLAEYGYRNSPLEVMAYSHESRFRAGEIYDAEDAVGKEMKYFEDLAKGYGL